jgi:ribosomal-protein-serine acetyltransferase
MRATVSWPPFVDAGDGVTLRAPDPVDAVAITEAIAESRDELRRFLDWAEEPMTVDQQAVRLAVHAEAFAAGIDAQYTVFVDDEAAGALGIHDRGHGSETMELGYWLRTSCTGRGVMTRVVVAAVEVLTAVGFERAVITCKEANVRSAAVAERAGFAHVGTADGSMRWERALTPLPSAR